MGSKKKPILPINLAETEGMLIFKTSLQLLISGFISFFFIQKFLGKKNKKTIIETISEIIFNRIKPLTAITIPFFIRIGIIRKIKPSFTICSIIFDNVCGNIFCLPKK